MSKLLAYKKANNARVIKNINLTIKYTCIGFATEDKAQYNKLVVNSLYKHIVFTNHKNISGIKQVKDTLKLSQVHGSNSIVETGNLPLITAFLPCICKPCRNKPFSI